MTTYIESKLNPDGTYDHSEVIEAHKKGARVEIHAPAEDEWIGYEEWENPSWALKYKYRAQVSDTYGIHESSSTLREVKGDAGPAVAEMLLDNIAQLKSNLEESEAARAWSEQIGFAKDERIKELEGVISAIDHSVKQALIPGNDWRRELRLIASTIELNKEPK